MLTTLQEINEMVVSISNYVVRFACEHTTSGQRFVPVMEALKNYQEQNPCCSFEDVLAHRDIICNNIAERVEVLDIHYDPYTDEFDVDCALNYCPAYEWCDGDEETFGCSYEEWVSMPTEPVVDQVSPSRYEEIAKNAIATANNKLEIEQLYNCLHDDLGMSDEEIKSIGVNEQEYDAALHYAVEETLKGLEGKIASAEEKAKMTETLVPMPDGSISVTDLKEYGYEWDGMLPMRAEAAEKVMQSCAVFMLYSDDTESIVIDPSQIKKHAAQGGLFGVEKDDWKAVLDSQARLSQAEFPRE